MKSDKCEKPDKRTVLRYIVLQLPGAVFLFLIVILLIAYTDWPNYLIWVFWGIWVFKDVLLFFRVWPSYRPNDNDEDPVIGLKGHIIKSCKPDGQVEIHGTPWRARIVNDTEKLDPGTKVVVKKREGLTLFVEAE